MKFETDFDTIVQQIQEIDPIAYGKTRNHGDGAVTRLSPYISRGVISTKQVYQSLLSRGFKFHEMVKLIQELAWRDYWQQVWIVKGDAIYKDLKHEQPQVSNQQIPEVLIKAKTGIKRIDEGIEELYENGYMHNHMRMYVASITCNIGQSHWKLPADWMYYYLLDADWASNALSWQWVAGANSNKKYYANQENINTFFKGNQTNSFLAVSYEEFPDLKIPDELKKTVGFNNQTNLPSQQEIKIDPSLPTLIYNFYNLDPLWKRELNANRVLLLEPLIFAKHPIADHSVEFMINLSKNIENIQIYIGTFKELVSTYQLDIIHYKEHPLNSHYTGSEDSRDWMFDVTGYFPSFFAFWKKCKKQIPMIDG